MSRIFDVLKQRLGAIENPSDEPSLLTLASRRRRRVLRQAGTLAAAGAAVTTGSLAGCAGGVGAGAADGYPAGEGGPRLGFRSVPIARDDAVHVPDGYTARVLIAWGDPVGDLRGMPNFRFDASNTVEEQALQSGTHHDGMFFFPLPPVMMQGVGPRPPVTASSTSGLLVTNHEYPDYSTMFADGTANWSLRKTRKAQAALGVSIIEVARSERGWAVVRPSHHARRIHAYTHMRIAGPAAGNDAMMTARSRSGRDAWGTYANCAIGWTPWGTYLTCEENFNFYFKGLDEPTPMQARYGISQRNHTGLWGDADPRFDVSRSPNEPNHFGWVVEIDPYDPSSVPVKRTALGRKKHEGAACAVARDRRLAFYMGDDQAFEYLYKFVTARPWNPDDRAANRDLLDTGTLYVARFETDGTGHWMELVHGRNGLTAANGFRSQGDVAIFARAAADRVGATPLDRPEWTAVDPHGGAVYVTLTHNNDRGRPGRPGADGPNPRAPNRFGHLLRIDEASADAAATGFKWEVFALAGDPKATDSMKRATIKGDAYASPDGLMIDPRGVLWVQTDMSPGNLLKGDHAMFGNNQMLAIDPVTRETRRFLTGPRGCEITGACLTPDARTMFVNVQHPGEGREGGSDPRAVREISNWPDHQSDGRPRSATVVITRFDNGIIGT
jgi:secreted PhoX family phosphatase